MDHPTPSTNSTSPQHVTETHPIPPKPALDFIYFRDDDEQQRIWADHFNHGPSTIEHFLSNYVPSAAPPYVMPTHANISFASDRLKLLGDPIQMCASLVAVVNQLVCDFPPDKRILAYDTHDQTFPAITISPPESTPDISVSWPSQHPPNTPDLNWSRQSIVFKVLPLEADDPVSHEPSNPSAGFKFQHLNTLSEIGMYARNLLFAHMSLFAFVIGIYGRTARIYRFDRAGVISSPSFNHLHRPELLGQFFWRLIHPIVQPIPALYPGDFPPFPSPTSTFIVGSDTSIMPVPEDHWPHISAMITKLGHDSSDDAIKSGYYSLVRLGDQTHPLRPCVTLGPAIQRSTGLFSRATAIWRMLPLPLTPNDSDSDPHSNMIYILKDVWHPCNMPFEVDNLKPIYASRKQDEHVRGLVKCCGYVHLGEVEGLRDHHRTVSAPVRGDGLKWDRYHTRTVLFPVGRPLETFGSTRALVEAFTDCVKGHQTAYEHSVLHRDVSCWNMMFSDTPVSTSDDDIGPPPKGFLLDFDHSLSLLESPTNPKSAIDKALSEITGTMPFMATALVQTMGIPSANTPHLPQHDLESFYWSLLYLLILHTAHNLGPTAFNTLFNFNFREGRKAASAKRRWLDDYDPQLVEIVGNAPLTTLLHDFTHLVRTHVLQQHPSSDDSDDSPPTAPLTHAAVLEIMHTALQSPGWPAAHDDRAFTNPQERANMFAPKEDPDTGYVTLGRFYSPADVQHLVRG